MVVMSGGGSGSLLHIAGLRPRTSKVPLTLSSVRSQTLCRLTPGNFAFNLFAVSERDLERLRQLRRDCFRQLRSSVKRLYGRRILESFTHPVPASEPSLT